MAQEPGFELTVEDEGVAEFIPFTPIPFGGRDLRIIDYVTKMPLEEFEAATNDPVQRGRGTILLAIMGTSINAKHPEWTIERITRIIDDVVIPEMTFLGAEEESNGTDPLPQEPKPESEASSSGSPSDASESSATPADTSAPEPTPSTSEPSSETPA
jgi:hypothetical protein